MGINNSNFLLLNLAIFYCYIKALEGHNWWLMSKMWLLCSYPHFNVFLAAKAALILWVGVLNTLLTTVTEPQNWTYYHSSTSNSDSCDSLQPTGPGSASGVHVLVTIFALKGRNENQTPGMCHKSVLCRAPCRELVQFKYINCSD